MTASLDVKRHDLEDGKYTLILTDGYRIEALRHGEPWRTFVGDKFISLLVQEFFDRGERLEKIREVYEDPEFTCYFADHRDNANELMEEALDGPD